MLLDRRTIIRSAAYGCMAAGLKPLELLSQSAPADELNVIATVLRAQCGKDAKHPVLIASAPFRTGPMRVLTMQPTPIQKAMHQVELPYLAPPAERMAEAGQLAAAYNRSLENPSLPITESAAFSFPHRLLDGEAIAQFGILNPSEAVYSAEIEAKRRAVSSHYRRLFAGSTTVCTVSRVAFSTGGVLAVVGLRSSGGSCWSESWEVLERSGGAWHSLHWGGGLLTCA